MTKTNLKEQFAATFEFFDGDEFAATTFLNKYALRDKEGNILEDDPNKTIDRVMSELASHMPTEYPTEDWLNKNNDGMRETWRNLFIQSCNKFKRVVPQGSVLVAAGNTTFPQTLSNCYVVPPPHDSIAGIMRSNEQMAQVYKRRGGCGIDLSTLRPEQALVRNAATKSTGAWGWANHFSNTCRDIAMLGRRGAQMVSLHIKHPDSPKWAIMKNDLTYCTGANVSLWITDEFMDAVKNDKDFKLQFPINSINPEITKTVKAKELWKTICTSAHKSAEPGLLMRDSIERNLPANQYEELKLAGVNPCSELNLGEFESCRLTTICLVGYVKNQFTKEAYFDLDLFKKDIRIALRLLDGIVTTELVHIDRIINKIEKEVELQDNTNLFNVELDLWKNIKDKAIKGRRIGLGTHGLADCLARLCIRYDSNRALEEVTKIYRTLRDISYDESVEMAIEYGAFPIFDWKKTSKCDFINRLSQELKDKIQKHGIRHVSLLTNAPTGTISIISKCSSGIEPTFRQVYTRRRKINSNDTNTRVDFIDNMGDKWQNFAQFENNVKEYFNTVKDKPADSEIKSERDLEKYLPDYFITSDKINWKKRIELQGTIQQFIDNSISSTINLPADTTVETVQDLYELAWEKGLKGVTVYREGSRSGVLISTEESQKEENPERPHLIKRAGAPKRPIRLPCEVHITRVQGEEWVVVIGMLGASAYEIFAGKHENHIPTKSFSGWVEKKNKIYVLQYLDEGKVKEIDINKYFKNSRYQSITRLLSMSIRHGTPLEYVIQQLNRSSTAITGFESAVSRILKKYIKIEDLQKTYKKCSKCDSTNIETQHKDGCIAVQCNDCGSYESKCG